MEVLHAPSPAPAGLREARFRLWLPHDLPDPAPARGVVCVSDYEAGRTLYDDPAWRAFAARRRFALLLHRLHTPAPTRFLAKGDEAAKALEDALAHFARAAGRPELARVGLIHTGLSQSGWQAVALANRLPARAIAAVPFHESTPVHAPDEGRAGSAGLRVPMLHVLGGECFLTPAIQPWVEAAAARGALWATVLQPGVPHHRMGEHGFALRWLDAVCDLRLPPLGGHGEGRPLRDPDPRRGWRGYLTLAATEGRPPAPGGDPMRRPRSTRVTYAAIAPYSDPAKPGALWLPSEPVARAWREYAQKGALGAAAKSFP